MYIFWAVDYLKRLSYLSCTLQGMKLKNCPECKGEGTIREIIWGMPAGPLDESKYVTGGCCVSPDGNDPRVTCIKCGWEN